jgi:hypothetical protein
MSARQNRFIYGPFLAQICNKIGIRPTKGNKEAVKAVFKAFAKIDTLGEMEDDTEFSLNIRRMRFITNTAWLLSVEAGIEIDLPSEYNVSDKSMEEFIKLIYNDTGTREASENPKHKD